MSLKLLTRALPALLTGAVVGVFVAGCSLGLKAPAGDGAVMRLGAKTLPMDYDDRIKPGAVSGMPLVLRYDDTENNASNLLLRNLATGLEQNLGAPNPLGAKLSYSVLHADGNNVYALWRPKLAKDVAGLGSAGDKFIYFRVSHDAGKTFSASRQLNDSNGAFAPVLASSGGRDVYVAWVDERDNAKYNIYLNSSQDGGDTWRKTDLRMDSGPQSRMAIDVSVVADGAKAWVAWVDGDAAKTLVVRATADHGATWSKQVVVAEPAGLPNRPTLVRANTRLLYYWYDAAGLQGAWSGDDGVSWAPIALVAGTEGMLGMAVSVDVAGKVHIALGRKSTQNDKQNVFYVGSDDGVNFSAPQRLNSGEAFKNTATLPEIAVNQDGAVMAVWQDHRYFRATVNANISRDGGRTWLAQDVSLNDKPGFNFAIYPLVSAAGSKFVAAWTEYDESTYRSGRSAVLIIDPVKEIVQTAATQPEEAQLRQRVEAFWDSRVKADWAKSYGFMDPLFQDRNTPSSYVRAQGLFKYFDFKVLSEKIDGRRAKVSLEYSYELPKTFLAGKQIEVPKTQEKIDQDWIWMGNDWYVLYKDMRDQDLVID